MKLASLLATFDSYGNLTEDQLGRIGILKEAFKHCATIMHNNCPDSSDTENVLHLLHKAMSLTTKAVQSEPNVFFANNLTNRGQFMKNNPDTWSLYMKAAGLTTPYELIKS